MTEELIGGCACDRAVLMKILQTELRLQSQANEPLILFSDGCICLLFVGKRLSLNEEPDWQKTLSISPLCAGKEDVIT